MARVRRAASIAGPGDRLAVVRLEAVQKRARELAGGKPWCGA